MVSDTYRIGGLICAIKLKTKLGFENFTVRVGVPASFSGSLLVAADLRKGFGRRRYMEGKPRLPYVIFFFLQNSPASFKDNTYPVG